MGHDHHHHHHSHSEIPGRVGTAFVIGIVLNAAFVIVEAGVGFWTNSLGLLSDAGHNLGDVLSLVLALYASKLALKKPGKQYTFGYRQSTILVALLNAVLLMLAMGGVAYEAIVRLNSPQAVEGKLIIIVASVGIVINAATAVLFLKDKEKDINVKGAYLHMAADALVSLGVVVAGVIILYTNWYWLDPVISLIIVLVIVFGTWGLLKESLRLTLNAAPKEINLEAIKKYFLGLKGVTSVHDLHVWAISASETALTIHLVMPAGLPGDEFYKEIQEDLFHKFNIAHPTVQIEKTQIDFDCGDS